MLTFRKLLADTTDKKQRKAMLAAKVEDMINTVVRQIAFYSFERKVHLERRNGELTAEINCANCGCRCRARAWGRRSSSKEGYETFWTYIPHFIHSPFYVYAYAFGDCLVNSLLPRFTRNRTRALPNAIARRCFAPAAPSIIEAAQAFGLDATDPKFWDGGLSGDPRRPISRPEDVGQGGLTMAAPIDTEKNRFAAVHARATPKSAPRSAASPRVASQPSSASSPTAPAMPTTLAAALGGLKGPIMKVAQLLATIPDALPPEYAAELNEAARVRRRRWAGPSSSAA